MNLGVGVNKFTATLCHVPSWWEEHTVAGRARLLLLFISRLSLCKDSRIGVRSPSGGTRGGLYDSGECTPFQGSRQTGNAGLHLPPIRRRPNRGSLLSLVNDLFRWS